MSFIINLLICYILEKCINALVAQYRPEYGYAMVPII